MGETAEWFIIDTMMMMQLDSDDIVGCQDSVACNYDANAIEQGECIYADDNCEMCYNQGALYDDDDGICDFDETLVVKTLMPVIIMLMQLIQRV